MCYAAKRTVESVHWWPRYAHCSYMHERACTCREGQTRSRCRYGRTGFACTVAFDAWQSLLTDKVTLRRSEKDGEASQDMQAGMRCTGGVAHADLRFA
jgi:hypothetical protein